MAAVAEKTGGKPIEIWFGDEARIGQKNKITRRWAKRGTGPSAPRDQRTASAYIFGAICPQHGKGAGLVLPACNTEAMALHLEEIAAAVRAQPHAIPHCQVGALQTSHPCMLLLCNPAIR